MIIIITIIIIIIITDVLSHVALAGPDLAVEISLALTSKCYRVDTGPLLGRSELTEIPLPQPPGCWDQRRAPPRSAAFPVLACFLQFPPLSAALEFVLELAHVSLCVFN